MSDDQRNQNNTGKYKVLVSENVQSYDSFRRSVIKSLALYSAISQICLHLCIDFMLPNTAAGAPCLPVIYYNF